MKNRAQDKADIHLVATEDAVQTVAILVYEWSSCLVEWSHCRQCPSLAASRRAASGCEPQKGSAVKDRGLLGKAVQSIPSMLLLLLKSHCFRELCEL